MKKKKGEIGIDEIYMMSGATPSTVAMLVLFSTYISQLQKISYQNTET